MICTVKLSQNGIIAEYLFSKSEHAIFEYQNIKTMLIEKFGKPNAFDTNSAGLETISSYNKNTIRLEIAETTLEKINETHKIWELMKTPFTVVDNDGLLK